MNNLERIYTANINRNCYFINTDKPMLCALNNF